MAGVGLAAVAVAALDAPAGTTPLLLAGAWLGSLLPDADKADSRIYRTRRLERKVWPVRVAGRLARIPLRLLILLGHRGLTHSLAAAALVAAAAALLDPAFGAGVAIGYGSHVAADACTPSGVPLLAPLTRRRWWLLPRRTRIPTGSLRELGVAALLTAGAIAGTVML
ncbi:metal-dependent hydrolase [Solirubrobacter sp. CPCC 204708]|uniref:Metal-dependent hydrolase n=1 Tax=Solirubrobacter deserti TaxID=2282478 RepID=A0ABT4RJG2_9ACTN|nr:metal-dependent hydrolase [Solirubrobacter deserti]MBE2319829.1 metal-dependent hydrolase [Solirubrobacter deserti]MDA0138690.1 metal-dependent hydrolase [Solirubrobacter deserti]